MLREDNSVRDFILLHNLRVPAEERINFLHGSTSAVFAFLGKKVNVADKNGQMIEKTIPYALIPTGTLRKQYGIFPISGERCRGVYARGSRKKGINYDSLSGAIPINAAYAQGYARIDSRADVIWSKNATFTPGEESYYLKSIKNEIMGILNDLSEDNYISLLKMLISAFTNLMLLDPDAKKTSEKYINLLNEKYKNLVERFPDNQNFKRYFDKYILKYSKIISGETLPFSPHDDFRKAINEQFPIIFCSTVTPEQGIRGLELTEAIYTGELSLATVKMVFTPYQYVHKLKEILTEIGFSSVEVLPYAEKKEYEDMYKDESRKEDKRIDLSETKSISPLKNKPLFFHDITKIDTQGTMHEVANTNMDKDEIIENLRQKFNHKHGPSF